MIFGWSTLITFLYSLNDAGVIFAESTLIDSFSLVLVDTDRFFCLFTAIKKSTSFNLQYMGTLLFGLDESHRFW
jgi:hypothetical protein